MKKKINMSEIQEQVQVDQLELEEENRQDQLTECLTLMRMMLIYMQHNPKWDETIDTNFKLLTTTLVLLTGRNSDTMPATWVLVKDLVARTEEMENKVKKILNKEDH
jgi:hypothetical protein